MPGQIAHFYLAARLAETFKNNKNKVLTAIHNGFEQWKTANNKLKDNLQKHKKSTKDMLADVEAYKDTLIDEKSDDIALFSAFTTGSLGPDIWTLPDEGPNGSRKGIFGSWNFDLGHYNLSHLFPQYTLGKIRYSDNKNSLQVKYETAYILGYISHIALDILTHLKVNVFAGAYHQQQQDVWEPEQGSTVTGEDFNIFNNHNKIEHYLDAFIRFFCFEGFYSKDTSSDTLQKFESIVTGDFKQEVSWNFPDVTGGKIYNKYKIKGSKEIDTLNLSTSLPGPFVHRYSDGCKDENKRVDPFIRKYYWIAYEKYLAYWLKEETYRKSLALKRVPNEIQKLKFFNFIHSNFNNCERKITDNYKTQSYYIRRIIPNLSSVMENTLDFFSPKAFGGFINGSLLVAGSFIQKAVNYLDGKGSLGYLNNWNLDTGMAIRIIEGKSKKNFVLPVCIDFKNVLDLPELDKWSIPDFDPHKLTSVVEKDIEEDTYDIPKKVSKINDVVDEAYRITQVSGQTTHKTHTKTPLYNQYPITITIKTRNTCFYDTNDIDEIGAYIFGSSSKSAIKPQVIQVSTEYNDKEKVIANTNACYKIKSCIEDFKDKPAKKDIIHDRAGRQSVIYSSTFSSDRKKKENGNDIPYINSQPTQKGMRILPRDIRVSTYRKYIMDCDSDSGDNFSIGDLKIYTTLYPVEDMAFSLFALYTENDSIYNDIFHNITFNKKQVDSLKKIDVIGVNMILLVYIPFTDNGKTKILLDEVNIDGQEQWGFFSAVQARLKKLKYYTGPVNGERTNEYKSSLIDFQRKEGLSQDGIAGPKTKKKLRDVCRKKIGYIGDPR